MTGWSNMMNPTDRDLLAHSQRVASLADRFGRLLGFGEDDLFILQGGAILHDIGKTRVPEGILNKAGPLSESEWRIMRRHPEYAYNLLSSFEYLKPSLDIPYCHHEWWDGCGYPRRLRGEEIPVSARVFALADVWDALRSDRPYRRRWPEKKAFGYIQDQAGRQFDPHLAKEFTRMVGCESLPIST
jgi:HD-GYP domain-containing protein (c-di-GMP phosphodiesterase class II)